jgi:DNA ligase-1
LRTTDCSTLSELPNYDLIVPALLKGGIAGLQEACKLTPGMCQICENSA